MSFYKIIARIVFCLVIICDSIFPFKSANNIVSVIFTKIPAHMQLFPRNSQDSASVIFAGIVQTAGYDSMVIITYKNNIQWKRDASKLNYSSGNAPFSVKSKIHAELSEYKFYLFAKNNSAADSVIVRDSIVCGDVYLINGQSNSHPINSQANYRDQYCRSFGKNTNYSAYNPADTLWGLARGDDAVNFHTGVWGIKLQQYIKENYNIPVCIINGGSGGSFIEYNLRNNSNHTDLNTTYGRLLYRAIKAGVQNNIKAMMWYQGESNMDTSWNSYKNNFTLLRNAWLENFPGMQKIYIFQVRMGCVNASRIYQSHLREVHRKLKEFFPEVQLMSTVGVQGHDGCHYSLAGYNEHALNIFRLISRDFYYNIDTLNIEPPNIKSAAYTSELRNRIRLIFSGNCNLVWPNDTLGASLKNYFYFDTANYTSVLSYEINKDTLFLNLNNSIYASNISYLPNMYYNGTTTLYKGPWLKNTKGVPALSFYKFPLNEIVKVKSNTNIPANYYLSQNYPNPFNSSTEINFGIAKKTALKIEVFNSQGELTELLFNGELNPGNYSVTWNSNNYASGIYFYQLIINDISFSKKMVLIK